MKLCVGILSTQKWRRISYYPIILFSKAHFWALDNRVIFEAQTKIAARANSDEFFFSVISIFGSYFRFDNSGPLRLHIWNWNFLFTVQHTAAAAYSSSCKNPRFETYRKQKSSNPRSSKSRLFEDPRSSILKPQIPRFHFRKPEKCRRWDPKDSGNVDFLRIFFLCCMFLVWTLGTWTGTVHTCECRTISGRGPQFLV